MQCILYVFKAVDKSLVRCALLSHLILDGDNVGITFQVFFT